MFCILCTQAVQKVLDVLDLPAPWSDCRQLWSRRALRCLLSLQPAVFPRRWWICNTGLLDWWDEKKKKMTRPRSMWQIILYHWNALPIHEFGWGEHLNALRSNCSCVRAVRAFSGWRRVTTLELFIFIFYALYTASVITYTTAASYLS